MRAQAASINQTPLGAHHPNQPLGAIRSQAWKRTEATQCSNLGYWVGSLASAPRSEHGRELSVAEGRSDRNRPENAIDEGNDGHEMAKTSKVNQLLTVENSAPALFGFQSSS